MADSKLAKQKYESNDAGFMVSGKRIQKHCQPCKNAGKTMAAKHECLDCADSKIAKPKYDSNDGGFVVSGKRIQKNCQPCKNAGKTMTAKHECLDCAEYMCTECSAAHTRFMIAKDHKISTIDIKVESVVDLESASDFVEDSGRKMRLKLVVSINLKQDSDNVNEPLYSGMDFLPDGRLVAVDNMNNKCLVYNEQLVKIGSLGLPCRPADVVAVSADEVAITTGGWEKIYFLNVSKSGELSLKRCRTVSYQYFSVCMMENESLLVTTSGDLQHVRLVSLSGEEKELGVQFPPIKHTQFNSACSYIEKYNKVVVTNVLDNNISIYNLTNNDKIDVCSFDIDHPFDVVIGPNDDIFVCSNYNGSLMQITHTGQIVGTYKLGIPHPRSIGISKDQRKIAVFNNTIGNHLVQLFEIKSQ